MKNTWNLEEGVEICRKIESFCPEFGCHVALTGGSLYKDGERKDLDLLFYRIRQVDEINYDGLYAALESNLGIILNNDYGFVGKFSQRERQIDCLFPEHTNGYYVHPLEEFRLLDESCIAAL